MERQGQTIWIQPANAGTPNPATGIPATAPLLEGPDDRIHAVLAALRQVREPHDARDIITSGRVQALRIVGDEATLTLRMGQGLCSDAHALAEQAFDALRAVLPDTDLYLHHDRPAGCAVPTTQA